MSEARRSVGFNRVESSSPLGGHPLGLDGSSGGKRRGGAGGNGAGGAGRRAASDALVRAVAAVPCAASVETLEPRRLMTTLVGGDIFEFIQADNTTVRIALRGNVVVEAIGASASGDNLVKISDVPGRFYGSAIGRTGTNVLGGLGGADGSQTVNNITIIDNINPGGTFLYNPEADNENISVQALASDRVGNVYGFNVVPSTGAGVPSVIQVLRFTQNSNQVQVVATLAAPIAAAQGSLITNTEEITDVATAAFNPVDGRLYFVVGTDTVQQLFSVAVGAGARDVIETSVVAFAGNIGGVFRVSGITWDQTGPQASSLLAYGATGDGDDDAGELWTVNLGNTAVRNNAVRVTLAGENVNDITGIEIVRDVPGAAETQVYASQPGQLLRINRANGAAENLGVLTDTDDTTDPIAGSDIGDITFNPNRLNPFTGQLGVLMGVDVTSDNVVLIDDRPRYPGTNLFSLYIVQADDDAEIIIGAVATDDPDDPEDDAPSERPMITTGGAGPFQVRDAQENQLITINPAGGSGPVLVGLKTTDISDDVDNEQDVALIAGTLGQQLGSVAPGTITAGVTSTRSLFQFLSGQTSLSDRLLTQNFDNVQGLTVDMTGRIIGVDVDGIGVNGLAVAGDQLSVIDPITGRASNPITITDSILNTPISGLAGLDFGNITGDNTEELLAVFATQLQTDISRLGSIGQDLDSAITAISFTQDGSAGFALVTRANGSRELFTFTVANPTFVSLGFVTDSAGNFITNANSLSTNSAGKLFTVGTNRDNPNPTQTVGGTFTDGTLTMNDLVESPDGNFYVLVGTASSGLDLYRVARNPDGTIPDGPLDQPFTRIGAIAAGGTSVAQIGAITDNGAGTIYTIGSTVGGLVPVVSGGQITVTRVNELPNESNLLYRGLTAVPSTDPSNAFGDVFSVISNGSTLELIRIQRDASGRVISTTTPSTLTDLNADGDTADTGEKVPLQIRIDENTGVGTGATTRILGIQSTDYVPAAGNAGFIYGIGYSGEDAAPRSPVVGTLGTVDPVAVAIDAGFAPFVLNNIAPGSIVPGVVGGPYDEVALKGYLRDQVTGGLAGTNIITPGNGTATLERVGSLTGTFVNNRIVQVSALETQGGRYFTAGWNIDAPAATATVGGNLGDRFDVRAIVRQTVDTTDNSRVELEPMFAITAEASLRLAQMYRIDRNQSTGAVSSFTQLTPVEQNPGAPGVLADPTVLVDLDGPSGPLAAGPAPLNFVYALANHPDPAQADIFYTVGSPSPGTNPTFSLYTLQVTGNSVDVISVIPLSISTNVKAMAFSATYGLYAALDEFAAGDVQSPLPASELIEIDPATGAITSYGFMAAPALGGSISAGEDDGIVPVNFAGLPLSIVDNVTGNSLAGDPAGNPNININALAADFVGNTYGFNVLPLPIGGAQTDTVVQFLSFGTTGATATVLDDLAPKIAAATGSEFGSVLGIQDVTAADFSPVDGLLYFAVRGLSGPAAAGPVRTQLFTYDLGTQVVTAVAGNFQSDADPTIEVTSLAFDQTAEADADAGTPPTADLYAYIRGNTVRAGSFLQVNLLNTNLYALEPVFTENGIPLNDVGAIAFFDDDPEAAEEAFYAIGDTPSRVYLVDIATGVAEDYGSNIDVDDATAPINGFNITGMTFARVLGPFGDDPGVFVAFDSTSDVLLYISPEDRSAEPTLQELDARGFAFHIDSSGAETLVVFDDRAKRLVEYGPDRISLVGGTPARLDLTPTDDPIPNVAIGLQSTATGKVNANTSVFTIDQYGRGYSIYQDPNLAVPTQLWTTANELYVFDTGTIGVPFADNDTDGIGNEIVSLGAIRDTSGVAVTNPVTALTFNFVSGSTDFYAVLRRQPGRTAAVTNPTNLADNTERLVTIQTAGPTTGLVGSVGAGDGSVLVNGQAVRLAGLDLALSGELIGYDLGSDASSTDQRLISLNLTEPGRSFAITDPADTVLSDDPRGFSSDPSGRFYTIDGNTVGGNVILLVSDSNRSIFRIETATGIATRVADLSDTSSAIQQPVLDLFPALAFDNDVFGFAVQRDFDFVQGTQVDRLVQVYLQDDPSTPQVEVAGQFFRVNANQTAGLIQVTGSTTPTRIVAMDLTADGRLIGLDAASNRQVQISKPITGVANTTAPTDSVFVSGVLGSLFGLTIDSTGRVLSINTGTDPDQLLFSNNGLALFTVNRANAEATQVAQVTVNGLARGDANRIAAMYFDTQVNRIYAIERDITQNVDRLLSIDPNSGIANELGIVRIGGTTNTRIVGLAKTAGGDLVAIHDPTNAGGDRQLVRINLADVTQSTIVAGSTPGSVSDDLIGLDSDTAGRFYSIDANGTSDAEVMVTPTQLYAFGGTGASTTAAATPALTLSDNGAALLDNVVGLAFNGADASPYIARRLRSATPTSADVLARVDGADGSINDLGAITVVAAGPGVTPITSNQAVQISGMTFSGGTLFAFDDLTVGGRRLVSIDTTNANATALGERGSVSSQYSGLTAANGVFYSINTAASPDTLVSSTDGSFTSDDTSALAPPPVPVLGTINPDTAVFTAIAQLGAGVITGVRAIAFNDPQFGGNGLLYVVSDANILYSVNALTGAIVQEIGIVRDAAFNTPLNVGSMDFRNGQLIIQDLTNNRLVDVELTTGRAGLAFSTPANSVSGTIGAISYDPANQRIIAVDNSTGSMPVGNEGTSPESASLLVVPSNLVGPGAVAAPVSLSKLFIAGTVTGTFDVDASIDQLYVGWIATGNIGGIADGADTTLPNNFRVRGNVGSLVTPSSVGTATPISNGDPSYLNGSEIRVDGRLGTLLVGGTLVGDVVAGGAAVATTVGTVHEELENSDDVSVGEAFETGRLRDVLTDNDTFETAERLPTGINQDGSIATTLRVEGTIFREQGDPVDYYAVPMLAGQQFQVQFTDNQSSSFLIPVSISVFDPAGRLIATNFSLAASSEAATTPIAITAQMPGEYRIAVTYFGDLLSSSLDDVDTAQLPYALAVTNLGNLAISSVRAQTSIYTRALSGDGRFRAEAGDIGAITSGGVFAATSVFDGATVMADLGSVRVLEGTTIGVLNGSVFGQGVSVSANNGSLGLVRATAAGGVLVFNPDSFGTVGGADTTVGGDVQMIDAAGTAFVHVWANRGLGVLRANDMATLTPSSITVNADNTGEDGLIDLIDVTGDLGTLSAGGPAITTNGGGNVRYMRVGGAVFRDRFFGGGAVNQIRVTDAQDHEFADDGGAQIKIRYDASLFPANPFFVPQLPEGPDNRPEIRPDITYTPYPIRGGGSSLINMTIVGTGVRLEASGGRAQDPRVEISTLNLSGYAGSTVARTGVGTNGVSFLSTTTGLPIAENAAGFTSAPVNLTGSSAIDVLDVQAPGQFITHWNNNTRGELVRLNNDGGTIGRINSLGAVGSAMSSTGAQIFLTGGDPTAAVQMRNPDMGIFSSGILSIDSRTSVANVSVFGFTGIGRITANSGGTDEPGVFEGITGPIYSLGPIDLVQIGEGVASTGSGDIFFGGIFGEGQIGRVEGRGGDIYGFVASNTGIDRIDLENGSLIDTTIGVYSGPFAQLRPLFTRALVDDDTGSTNNPSFEIDQITVRGNGGIIGAVIQAADIRDIVADQFFFTSVVSSEGGGFFDRISVGGYGIRNVLINAGSSLRKLEATGRGGTMATSSISQSVRRSEFEAINSFTSRGASVLNDIHAVLGTSAAITTIPGITETGIIEDVVATGNGTLGQVTAYQIRGSQPGVTDSRFAFGNSIGLIKTRSLINGLIVDTGRLSRFEPAGDVLALDLKVAGKIGRLRIRGSLADNSVISTTGPNGVISELRVDGNFEGTISATGRVTRIIIRGDLTEGSIIINPTNPSRRALDLLSVGGDLRASSINVTGNIGEIRTAGSLGIEGEAGTLTINGSLTRLRVGTDRSRTSVMWLGLDVNGGSVGTIDVRGRIDGAINVDGDIRSLVVRNNGLAGPDILVDPINTGGRILRATFAGGNLTAAVTAFGDIRSFVVSGGSLQSGANIISTTGSIGSITVRGGEMLSSVSTTQRLGSLFVDGNIGNTGTTANISAASVGRLTTRANLFSDVSVAGRLDNLTIAGNLEADSRVSANSIRRQSIRGAINGEVVIA